MIKKTILSLSVMIALVGAPLSYAQERDTLPKIPIEAYGQIFNVKPVEIEGALLSYSQVKAYVPYVLKSMRTQERKPADVSYHLHNMAAEYEDIFNISVETVARRIKHFLPNADLTTLEYEVADHLRAGQWKRLAKRYQRYSRSLQMQILEAQKIHNKYLAVLYLAEMVSSSVELATIDESNEVGEENYHVHDHPDEMAYEVSDIKYQYSFGYKRSLSR